MPTDGYDPFAPGPHAVAVHATTVHDGARARDFPCDVWHPADVAQQQAPRPLVLYSHQSGGNRHVAAYLYHHLASHGYLCAAMDHSEVVAPRPPRDGESAEDRAARVDAVVAARVPDMGVLLDHLLAGDDADIAAMHPDPTRIALVGHSFGGWTVLATPGQDSRIRAVVAHAPGGGPNPRPGIVPVQLDFDWGRDVPTLYLTGEDDVLTPLEGIRALYERTPATRHMVVLRRADHQHFVDDVAGSHEGLRTAEISGEAAWIPAAMRPIEELCPPPQAHIFTRGLTLAHLDATLRDQQAAAALLDDPAERLAALGIDAFAVPA